MGHTPEKIKGKTKKMAGKMSGDKKMQMKGKFQEEKAKAKDTLGL